MSLIKRNSGGTIPFRNILGDFFSNDELLFDRMVNREFIPAVNIYEKDKTYEIEFVVPGMKKDDFKVKVENDVLTVSAERKEEKKEVEKNYTRQEYSFNSFSRSFTLPDNAKSEEIKAHYEDGLLKLTILKNAATVSKVKEIAVL